MTANPTLIYARLNKKNYDRSRDASGTGDIALPLVAEGKPIWFKHPNDQIDAAVILLGPSALSAYETAGVFLPEFPTPDEQRSIRIGDQLLSAGLIPGRSGQRRNYPFFKFGAISSMPDEPVDIDCQPGSTRSLKVWFVAANLVPGNSGSPIFSVPLGGNGASFGGRVMLLGVQSMSFLAYDVAGMTPSQFVYEIIEKMNLPDADLRRGIPQNSGSSPPQK